MSIWKRNYRIGIPSACSPGRSASVRASPAAAHVQEFHSLRSAAKAMNMAYSKAWTIVKSSERILGVQLLHTSVGGRSGGGAQLTEEAVLLLDAYTAFCADLHAAGDALFAQHFGYLEGRS